jgi:hypothetical protein
VTIAWAFARPALAGLLELAEPLGVVAAVLELELLELHAASSAAAAIAPAPIIHLCVIAYAFALCLPSHRSRGGVNGSFLLRYVRKVAKA